MALLISAVASRKKKKKKKNHARTERKNAGRKCVLLPLPSLLLYPHTPPIAMNAPAAAMLFHVVNCWVARQGKCGVSVVLKVIEGGAWSSYLL